MLKTSDKNRYISYLEENLKYRHQKISTNLSFPKQHEQTNTSKKKKEKISNHEKESLEQQISDSSIETVVTKSIT